MRLFVDTNVLLLFLPISLHIEANLADTILGCCIFRTFSLDDPVSHPREEDEDNPCPWLK